MSTPSPERMAALAMKCAGEAWQGGCIVCGQPSELHEIQKRQMRHTMGAAACILGANLAPLCPQHHREWEKLEQVEQMYMLHNIFIVNTGLRVAQRDQLIALKARVHTA